MLPAYKGLFPYIWATINDDQIGISYHLVEDDFDSGLILHQIKDVPHKNRKTMIAFYIYVFRNFALDIQKALNALVLKKSIQTSKNIKHSYFGLPNKADIKKFRKSGGKIISLADLFLALKL